MITLTKALKVYGTKTRLAEILGISSQAISQWQKIPMKQQLRLKYEIHPTAFKDDSVDA
jgi:DNA-binding transcriptional regulator YdaS (Cro superfamily)